MPKGTQLQSSAGALEDLAAGLLDEAKSGLVKYRPTDLDLYAWAQENRNFKGHPFSLDGHEYLREIYEQPFKDYKYLVMEKAAQMGASELVMTLVLWFCDRHPRRKAIYFLPSDKLAQDFSHERFQPILDDSPRLVQVRGDVQNVGLKQVGKSSVYIRGMFTKSNTKSIDADMLVFDELDEAKRVNKQQAIERVSHSEFAYITELSTPTLPGYGIDEVWQETDQRYWHLRCRCPEGTALEENWPECVGQRNGEFFLRCPKCGKEKLDPEDFAVVGEYRGWIPRHPGRERRGYHLTQLFSKFISLKTIWELWESGKDREEFHNSKLGLPFAGDRMPLRVPGVLEACRIGDWPLRLERKNEKEKLFIGADQGLEMHVVVTRLGTQGRHEVVGLYRDRFGGSNDPFLNLSNLIKKLKPKCCVVDAMPNIGPARLLADAHKSVFICHYTESQRKELAWKRDVGQRQVLAHRTDSLNDMAQQWLGQEFIVPQNEPEVDTVFSHLRSLAKVIQTDEETGIQREVFIHIGADHYAHAFNYAHMAASYPYGKSSFEML